MQIKSLEPFKSYSELLHYFLPFSDKNAIIGPLQTMFLLGNIILTVRHLRMLIYSNNGLEKLFGSLLIL